MEVSASSTESLSLGNSGNLGQLTQLGQIGELVSQFLNDIGGGLDGNQSLKLLIAVLILNALLAADGGSQQQPTLDLLGSGRGNRASFDIQSATSIVQVSHFSATLVSSQAVQSLGQTPGDPSGGTGEQLDLSA
jgi:predicted lipid-binding transport protein (Tim44 family)